MSVTTITKTVTENTYEPCTCFRGPSYVAGVAGGGAGGAGGTTIVTTSTVDLDDLAAAVMGRILERLRGTP